MSCGSRVGLELALRLEAEEILEHFEEVRHLVAGAELAADRGALLDVAAEGDVLRFDERLAESRLRPARVLPESAGLAQVLGDMLLVVQLPAVAGDHVLEVR